MIFPGRKDIDLKRFGNVQAIKANIWILRVFAPAELLWEGAQEICIATTGHADKITLGKAYEILDERPNDLLIRIEDARGKIVWMPKSHFNLV